MAAATAEVTSVAVGGTGTLVTLVYPTFFITGAITLSATDVPWVSEV